LSNKNEDKTFFEEIEKKGPEKALKDYFRVIIK
jgi:hypothetical protein